MHRKLQQKIKFSSAPNFFPNIFLALFFFCKKRKVPFKFKKNCLFSKNCPYQELDGHDKDAYHVWLQDETGIQAYLRVLDKGVTMDEVAIGRVVTRQRRIGLGTKILNIGIEVAKDKFAAKKIMLEAQVYAKSLYEKAGFRQVGEEFLEDGIPHIPMLLEI